MIRVLIVVVMFFNNCVKKCELFLDDAGSNIIIEIDEERIYKF